jgi:translocation and assembly module TamB
MKRALIISGIGLVAALLIAAGSGWWYFFHTRAGVEFILARLDGLPGMHMQAEDVSGTLSGPLRLKRFELDGKYVHLILEDVEVQLTPAALLAQTVRAQYVRVGRATIEIKQNNEPPSDQPMRFLPRWLRISLGRLDVTSAHLALANGTGLDATAISITKGVSLNSRQLEIGAVALQSPYANLAGDLSLQAQRPIGLKGRVQTVLVSSTPQLHLDVSADGNIESMHIDAQLLAPAAATLNATLARTESSWHLKGNLTSAHFDLAPWVKKPPFSLQQLDMAVDASLERILTKGSVIIPEVDALPIQIDATTKIDTQAEKRALIIERAALRLTQSETTLDGQARIQLMGEHLIDARVQWRNLSWPLRDGPAGKAVQSPQGTATLAGSLPYEIHADADVKIAKPHSKENGLAHLSAAATVSDKEINVEQFSVAALKGNAHGSGNLALTSKRKWRINVDATHINPDFVDAALPGTIDAKINAQGEGFDGATFAVQIDELRGVLRGEKIAGHGGLGHTSDGWYTKAFTASFGENHVAFNGQFGNVNNLTWRIDVPKVEQLLTNSEGQIHSQGEVHGERAVPQLRGKITAKQLRVGDWHLGTLALDADVDVRGKVQSTLQADATDVGFGVFIFDTMHIAGSGNDVAHQLQLNATAKAEHYESVPTLDWQAQGSYDKRTWHGTFSTIKFSDHYGRKPTLVLPDAVVSIAEDKAQAQQLCLILGERRVCADADWNRETGWHLAFASDELELNLFDTLLGDKTQLEGRWQLQGRIVAANNAPLIGETHLRIADGTVLYEAIEGVQERVQVGSGNIDLAATPQQLDASLGLTKSGTTNVDAALQIKRLVDVPLTQAPLTARLQARTSDANVLPLFFTDLDHVAGILQSDLTANGTLASPLLRGRIQLQDGELDLYRINLALRAVAASIDIADNRIDFAGNGKLGGGTLNAKGAMQWQDGKARGELQLQGADLLVADLPEYRVTASPDLKFSVDGKRIDASGTVLIPSAHIQPVDLRGAVQRSNDVHIVGMQPAEEGSDFQVYSDINVRLGDDVQLNTFGLQGKLTGAVTATTKPNEPARGKGELSVQKGRYQAYGQDLDIEHGRLLFDVSPLDNPGLDILATRTIEEQHVGVYVRGTLRGPRLSFYSDPSLTQSQTVAYLLTGKPMEDMSTSDSVAVGKATDALALQGGGLLASQVGRRVGLEEVSVESNGLDDTSLVLGKFLSPRLFVSYGISLTESINTFKARYTISDRWLLKTEAGENQSADVEFRIER